MVNCTESTFRCGCSEEGEHPICPIHGKQNISTCNLPKKLKVYRKGRKTLLRSFNLDKLIKYLPMDFDYLNIDCTKRLLSDTLLKDILSKSSLNVFIQVDVTGLDSIAMVLTQFELLGLKFAGESSILSEKVSGYYPQTALYFYYKPKHIQSIGFSEMYLSESNSADRFWISNLKRKSLVYLNVSSFKCAPIVDKFKYQIFIHTQFNTVVKRIISTEYKKLFPLELEVPEA